MIDKVRVVKLLQQAGIYDFQFYEYGHRYRVTLEDDAVERLLSAVCEECAKIAERTATMEGYEIEIAKAIRDFA